MLPPDAARLLAPACSLFMGNMELGSGGRQILKAPIGTYEFGAK